MNGQTRRQELRALLQTGDQSFEGMRMQLGLPSKVLEEELRHVEKSARHDGEKLVVTPAFCEACDFEFKDRKHYQTPSRCPKCKKERVADALFRLER